MGTHQTKTPSKHSSEGIKNLRQGPSALEQTNRPAATATHEAPGGGGGAILAIPVSAPSARACLRVRGRAGSGKGREGEKTDT